MSDRAQLAAYIQALYNRVGSSEERPGDLQEVRHYLGQFKQILTQSGPDAEVWAELHTLREAVKGPDGFATWQDAATAERVRRVKAENELKELKEKLAKQAYVKLGESEVREICRKQTNSAAVETYWESFLRISNAIQDEVCRVNGLGGSRYVPLSPEFKEKWIKALTDGSHIQSGYKALRHSSSYSALGVAKNIQGAVWKLGLFQLPTYQDLLSGETEKYVPVLNQEQIDPEALKALEKIQREHPFYEVARWIKYNL